MCCPVSAEISTKGLLALRGQPRQSRWITLDQLRIDAFAAITEDTAPLHVDPLSADAQAFGGTLAHGFLTLSLLSTLVYDIVPRLAGHTSLNAGFDRVRFVAPVPSGSRVRGIFTLETLEKTQAGQLAVLWAVQVEIEGADKPALVARWLNRFIPT